MALTKVKTELKINPWTIAAGEAITNYTMIGCDGNKADAGDACIGAVDHAWDSGDPMTVYGAGSIMRVEGGGTFSIGDQLVADADGHLVAATAVSAIVTDGATAMTGSAETEATVTVSGNSFSAVVCAIALEAGTDGTYPLVKIL